MIRLVLSNTDKRTGKCVVMSTSYVDALLQELGAVLGIAGLEFNDERLCTLVVSHRQVLSLRHACAFNQLILFGPLGYELPDNPSRKTLNMLMSTALNPLMGSAPGVGWDPDLGLIGFQAFSLEGLNVHELETSLGSFIEWADTFSQQLAMPVDSASSFQGVKYDHV
ncbi:hypothetical protein B7453_02225 [Pseudomonas sp. IB20]|nr:hypothetical protein B7453_02225 [Pseudomonas sp. IB20]